MNADNKGDDRSSSIHVRGNVDHSVIVPGDGNTVSYKVTNVFGSVDAEQFSSVPSQPLSKQEYRWRQVLVENVKHYWIEGVLEKSLYNQALIELTLEERSQAVASPLSGVEEFPEDAEQLFPEGTKAADVFDNLGAGRTLLILGAPGAGKTTMLLKLAQTLITRIGDDFSQPIPVILNLSSWAKKRQPITEWLVQELYKTFQISRSLGTTWIEEEQLTLCLDGLDEVAAQHQNACIQALNHFLQSHGRTEAVVCSRIRDYEALSDRLRVRRAIYVQSLTTKNIDSYLESVGEPLAALNTLLNQNDDIKAFAYSPLMLSVMSLAYKDCSLDVLSQLSSADNFRKSIFDAYVERMFNRRKTTQKYLKKDALHWLICLSTQMKQNSQTMFYIERLQPSWLHTRTRRIFYRLECGLAAGLSVGILCGLSIGMTTEPTRGLRLGAEFGLMASLIVGSLGNIKTIETLKWSWKESLRTAYLGAIFGSVPGAIIGSIYELPENQLSWLSHRFSVGISAPLFSWLPETLIAELMSRAISGVVFGIVVASIGALFSGFLGGFRGPSIREKTYPNQGILKSAMNATVSGMIVGLAVGTTLGLATMSNEGISAGLAAWLNNFLLYGLTAWLIMGGAACLKHFILRCSLYRQRLVPWDYACFLDDAVDHLFLQKVGGGYIFIHRSLLEYFSQMYSD